MKNEALKMKNKSSFMKNSWGLIIALALLTSCEGFFGKKTEKDFIDIPVYNDKPVFYVPVQPVWDGFVFPTDVITGYDELIYVADAGTHEIVQMDQAGNEIGRFFVPGLKSICQDRTLDILAVGTFDTLGYSLSCVYRIEQKENSLLGLNHAVIENKIVHPFYYKISFNPGVDNLVELTGVAAKGDNYFYVSRTGPSNSTTQFGGPDDAILFFNEDDDYISPIAVSTGTGIFTDFFKKPASIVSIAQPPQSPVVSSEGDFVYTSFSTSSALQVQYIDVAESDFGITYSVKEMITGDTSKADGFLYNPYRFAAPADVTFTGDGTNYIFVVDSEKDSLYQFTNTGLEGVKPPAGSSSAKNIRVSFGGNGAGLTQFNQPMAVAYLNQILYVADAGNGRILRFKLTTDFD